MELRNSDMSRREYAGRLAVVVLVTLSYPIIGYQLGLRRSMDETFAIAPITRLPRGTGFALLALGLLIWYVTITRFDSSDEA